MHNMLIEQYAFNVLQPVLNRKLSDNSKSTLDQIISRQYTFPAHSDY